MKFIVFYFIKFTNKLFLFLDSNSSGKRRGESSFITESSGKSSASGTNSTSGMGKKSASASQLSATGEWYFQKRIASFHVQ